MEAAEVRGEDVLELNQIYNMDVVEGIELIDDESIDCCITSPPYWACRDYGLPLTKWPETTFRPNILYDYKVTIPAMECCLGLEEDPTHYIAHMVYIFRQIKAKLKKAGNLWLNIGDTYSQPNYGNGGSRIIEDKKYKNCPTLRRFDAPKFKNKVPHKNLMGIPWAVAEALKADGWFLRMDIIWHKPNPMPESANDRPTKAHEYIFLLSKSKIYYYNAEAIKEPCICPESSQIEDIERAMIRRRETSPKGSRKTFRGGGTYTNKQSFDNSTDAANDSVGNEFDRCTMKNKRSVWTVASQPVKFAHFATYPSKLIEPCILAGCPVGGTILEPFSGSGTTVREAIANQRNYIAFELNPEYIKMAEEHRLDVIQIKMNLI